MILTSKNFFGALWTDLDPDFRISGFPDPRIRFSGFFDPDQSVGLTENFYLLKTYMGYTFAFSKF